MVEINTRTGLPNIATVSTLAGGGISIKEVLVDNSLELQRISNVLNTQLTSIAQNMDALVNATLKANENEEFRLAEEEAEARRRSASLAGQAGEDSAGEDLEDDTREASRAGIMKYILPVLAGIGLGIQDAFAGMDLAEAMGAERLSGFIGGFFGGTAEGGFMSALTGSIKGAATGAIIGGATGGPIGAIAGALLGGALFAITGWIGAQRMIDFIDPLIVEMKRLLGLSVTTTEDELKDLKDIGKSAADSVQKIKDDLQKAEDAIDKAIADGAPTDEINNLRVVAIKLREELVEAQKASNAAQSKIYAAERDKEKNAVNEAKAQVRRNNFKRQQLAEEEANLKFALTFAKEGSDKERDLQERLAVVISKQEQALKDQTVLEEDLLKKRELLLEQDRELIRIAEEEGGTAPLRARINVWSNEFPQLVTNRWEDLKSGFDNFLTNLRTDFNELQGVVDIKEKFTALKAWWENFSFGDYASSKLEQFQNLKGYKELKTQWENLDLWPDETFAKLSTTIGSKWDELSKKIYDPETGAIFGINFGAVFDTIPSLDDIIASLKVSLSKTFIGKKFVGDTKDLVPNAEKNVIATNEALASAIFGGKDTTNELAEFEKAKVQLEAIKKAVAADARGFSIGTFPKDMTFRPELGLEPGTKDFGDATLAALHGEEVVLAKGTDPYQYIDNIMKQQGAYSERALSDIARAEDIVVPTTGYQGTGRAPINVRNNNPLNIRPPSGEQFQGTIGQAGGFATFATPEMGFRAAAKLLQNYQDKYGLDTVLKIIQRWAPSGDNNNPTAYAQAVASKIGVGINDAIDLRSNPELTQRLIAAMAEHEGGKSMQVMGFNNDQIASGLAMATGTEVTPTDYAGVTPSAAASGETTTAEDKPPSMNLFDGMIAILNGVSKMDDKLRGQTSGNAIDGNLVADASSDMANRKTGSGAIVSSSPTTVMNNTTSIAANKTISTAFDARNNNRDASRYYNLVTA